METRTTDNSDPILCNDDMERGVLGMMLLQPEGTIPEVEASLLPDSFYSRPNRLILAAILEIHRSGASVDLLTATQRLRDQGNIEDAGGAAYITGLLNETFTTAHLKDYIREINAKAVLRKCRAELTNANQKITADPGTLRQTLDELRESAEGCSRELDLSGQRVPSMRDILLDVETLLFDKRYRPIPTFSEGINWNLNGGFHPGKVYTFAGAAGGGKTTLIYQIAEEIARANHRQGE